MTISEYQFFGYGTAPGQEENMSDRVLVFEGKWGKVWRTGDDYGTLGAGHAFCVEMAKEIERLREQLAAAQKLAEVGKAIERAQREMLFGWMLEIIFDSTGCDVKSMNSIHGIRFYGQGDTLAAQINDAVKRAKEA